MNARYANNTSVPSSQSVAEIQRHVRRFGATEFGYCEFPGSAMVGFACRGYRVELTVRLPGTDAVASTPTGRKRSASQRDRLRDQETRRRWRSLAAVVKALLVAVQDGILTFEEAFLSHLVLGTGATIGATMLPALQQARLRGTLPASLRITGSGRLLTAEKAEEK